VTRLLYNWLIWFFLWLARVLPVGSAYRIAESLTWFHYHLFPTRRKGATSNILAVLGDGHLDGRVKQATYGVFRNFMRYLVEMFYFPRITEQNMEEFISLEGLEHLDHVLNQGKGAVLVTVHLGNWELAGAALSLKGYPLNVIVGDQMTTRVKGFAEYRWEKGTKAITPDDSLKQIYQSLKGNEIIVILLDGYLFDRGVTVRFFEKPIRFPRGAAKLSYRTGAPIVPGVCLRDESRHLVARVLPAISMNTNVAEDDAVQAVTEELARMMEHHIRSHPDQWCIFRPMWEADS
jgi:KDO2-lipid IV(A) lauroyltransferase